MAKTRLAPKGQTDKYQDQQAKAVERVAKHSNAATIRTFEQDDSKMGRAPKKADMPDKLRSPADPRKPLKGAKYKF